MIEKTPKVSVCVVTYNHEKYIRECLESIVTQECNFDFEVIVGEDCSTDGTRVIVREFAEKYPNIVKPIFHDKNVGGNANYFSINNIAKGEYICHIDGDDYALPGKLQAQADFMDKTPDCNICFHRVRVLFPDGTIKDDLIDYEKIKDGFERKDLCSIGSIASNSSKMYRKGLKHLLNNKNTDLMIMDFFANIVQIENKKAMYSSNEIYGVYRANVGIMKNNKIIDVKLSNLEKLLEFFPEMKQYINTYIFILLLVDIKNRRNSWKKHFKFWLKTFNIRFIFNFLRVYPLLKYFRVP